MIKIKLPCWGHNLVVVPGKPIKNISKSTKLTTGTTEVGIRLHLGG